MINEGRDLRAELALERGRRRTYALLSRRHADSVRGLDDLRRRLCLEGSTILCVGNGPSLHTHPIEDLDQFPALLTNHAARALARRPAQTIGTVLTDDYRLLEAAPKLPMWARPLFVSSHLAADGYNEQAAPIVRQAEYAFRPAVRYIEGTRQIPGLKFIIDGNFDPGFACDLTSQSLFLNRSVIFSAMQIACRLGARRIVLIAVEMDYTGPQLHCVPGTKTLVANFDYETMARPSFELAGYHCGQMGVEIVNATPGGRVEVFPRVALCDLATQKRAA